jgi:ribosomal protein S18 acetylase RimI-like enzyme
VIGTPGETGVAHLRAPEPSEADAVQAVWEASSLEDDPIGWPRGGWSIATWATVSRVLVLNGRLIGIAAVRAKAAPDRAMPARVALDVSARQPKHAALLVQGVLDLVRQAEGERIRLFVPSRASWALTAVAAAGFKPVRTVAHMLLPADAPSPSTAELPDLTVRSIRAGEDEGVLAALNRAWAGTWNFVSITMQMLDKDLQGQRAGMLLCVDPSDRIVATCHAVFDPSQPNAEGHPRAWISNLTVDPDFRGRGLARAMLAAGIVHLRTRGAASITLGVDADDPAPFTLYRSVGFQIESSLEAWDVNIRKSGLH